MNRTLRVTLVVGAMLTAMLMLLVVRQRQVLVVAEARAAEERVRDLEDAPLPVSGSSEQGAAGVASSVELPAVEPPRSEALPPPAESKVGSTTSGDGRPATVPADDAVVGDVAEVKVFHLQNVDAAETLGVIQPLLPREAKVSADQRTNSLIVSATANRLAVITALLIALDESPAKKRLPPSTVGRPPQNIPQANPALLPEEERLRSNSWPRPPAESQIVIPIGRLPDVVRLVKAEFGENVPLETRVLNKDNGVVVVSGSVTLTEKLSAFVRGVERQSSVQVTSKPTSDNEDAAMDREAKQLAVRVRTAQEPEKSKLRTELESLTDRHFEYRQQRRKLELDELADRVDKLQVAHHSRQENKSEILKRRLGELLDEENELKWDDTRTKPLPALPVATPKSAPKVSLPNLDGEWLLTLPSGFEFVGKIEKQPEGCWSFREMQSLSGYYQHEGNVLKAVITDKKDPQECEWLLLDNHAMVLTKSSPVEKVGGDYRGAILRRGAKPKRPSERNQAPTGANAPSGNVENLDPRQVAIRAAHRKAAEARLKLAKFQLDTALESVRKVPGSISQTEIERLKADVAVAEAELELVIAGANPRAERARRESLLEPVAAARLQQAEAALNSVKTEHDRMQKLLEKGAISRAEADRVAAQLEEAKASVDLAKAELEEARSSQPKSSDSSR